MFDVTSSTLSQPSAQTSLWVFSDQWCSCPNMIDLHSFIERVIVIYIFSIADIPPVIGRKEWRQLFPQTVDIFVSDVATNEDGRDGVVCAVRRYKGVEDVLYFPDKGNTSSEWILCSSVITTRSSNHLPSIPICWWCF